VVSRQNANIADTLQVMEVAMATTFWLSTRYNFGCVVASDTLFDASGGFSRSRYPTDMTEIRSRV